MAEARRAVLSVVIPAHEEERVIGRCLEALLTGPGGFDLLAGEAEVVVVANGCNDRTAEVASRWPGVKVVELSRGSKPAALNAGDEAVKAFPRIYLDADVVVSAEAVRAVAARLPDDEPRSAAPAVVFVTDGRTWTVRAFYKAYLRTPYVKQGLVGLGLYGVSSAGRARWGRFPEVTSDDLFVQRTFACDERVVVAGHHFAVETPRTLGSLLAVRTRVAQGNAELATGGRLQDAASTTSTVRALVGEVRRRPWHLPSVVVYVAVVAVARRRARRSPAAWHRDASTR